MRRRLGVNRYICVLGLLVLGASTVWADTKPNIVLILADDLGYGDLSSYGAADMRTPHIDGLMKSGMRFDQFYSNCPVCSPTRAALLSGRYPDLVGVPGVIRTDRNNSWGNLDQNAVLMPEVLRDAGYYTALVGKWHLGLEPPYTPNERGFDYFQGWLSGMMSDYYTHRRHDINYMRRDRETIDPEGHATDLFTDWAIEVVEDRKNKDKPFFLYLAYTAPHNPIQPPDDVLKQVMERETGIDEDRAKIVALIEHMDQCIGRVISALKASGQMENTVIVFASDNGGMLRFGATNGPLRGGKGDMSEGGIRVPACVVWPGHIEAGSRSDRVAMTMDLFPTLAALVGAEETQGIEGVSILDTLLGKTQAQDERSLVWVRREGGAHNGRAYYAIRRGKWKLLQNSPFEPMALYDLESDPQEKMPLPKNHPQYRALSRELMEHISRSGRVPWQREE
ncbi:MAG: sulfatase-like hydrolase/transferase [Candidatus Hydrogenedentota bacterium]